MVGAGAVLAVPLWWSSEIGRPCGWFDARVIPPNRFVKARWTTTVGG